MLLLILNSIRDLYFARLADFRGARARPRGAAPASTRAAAAAVADGDGEGAARGGRRARRGAGAAWLEGWREARARPSRRGARRRGRRAAAAAAAGRRHRRRGGVPTLARAAPQPNRALLRAALRRARAGALRRAATARAGSRCCGASAHSPLARGPAGDRRGAATTATRRPARARLRRRRRRGARVRGADGALTRAARRRLRDRQRRRRRGRRRPSSPRAGCASSCSRRARARRRGRDRPPARHAPRLYRDGGQVATIGRPPIVLPLGRGRRRHDDRELGHVLPHAAARCSSAGAASTASTPTADAVFERVEAAIGVAEVPPELAGAQRRADPARRRAARLVGRLPAPQRARLRRLGRVRLRLPDGRQAARRRDYLPRALEAGATLVTGARASGSSSGGGRAPRRGGRTARRPAARPRRTVVVAAGAVHTPLLLARSGLGGGSGALGRNLSLHPATAVWGVFDEEVDMAAACRSPTTSTSSPPTASCSRARRPAGLPRARRAVRRRRAARADARPPPRRAVRADGQRPLARPGRERARAAGGPLRPRRRATPRTFHAGLLRLAELMWAAGARRVILPVARVPELRDGDRRRCASSTCGRATSS